LLLSDLVNFGVVPKSTDTNYPPSKIPKRKHSNLFDEDNASLEDDPPSPMSAFFPNGVKDVHNQAPSSSLAKPSRKSASAGSLPKPGVEYIEISSGMITYFYYSLSLMSIW
jgi:hypothetical protein